MPSEEFKEPLSLSDILRSTSFVSASGRVYQLFGNEEDVFAMPSVPPPPSALVVPKSSTLSLEEALQQIESFSVVSAAQGVLPTPPVSPSVRTIERICPTTDSPTLHLFQAWSDSAAPRLVKRGRPEPIEEKSQSLRLVAASVEEPFIVPFTKPETAPEETETVPLKIARPEPGQQPEPSQQPESGTEIVNRLQCTETTPSFLFQKKILPKRRYRQEKAPYRKRVSLRSVPAVPMEESLTVEAPTFRWSERLDSLMQTAENPIRCLVDHLVVQVNQGTKTIGFKSIFPGDGCSTVLLCAVRALTERNYRILLIDAHYQHIDLPKQLNVLGDANGELVRLNDHLGLWVWQESKTVAENRTILARTLAVHREEYDLILFDSGSVTESPLAELIEFWNQMEWDGIVLVSNRKRPEEIPISHIAGRLRQHHLHLIGITENYV